MKISPGLPLEGRVKDFAKNWEKSIKDPAVLNIVHGYQIPFIEHCQTSLPAGGKTTPEEKETVEEEINQMLRKGAILKVATSLSRQIFEQHFYRPQEK